LRSKRRIGRGAGFKKCLERLAERDNSNLITLLQRINDFMRMVQPNGIDQK
jgi:hypothetical protein